MNLLNLIAEYFLDEATGTYEELSTDAKEVAQEIMKALSLSKEEIGKHARNRIIVKSDKPRAEIFSSLAKMGFERATNVVGSHPGGFRTPNGIEIIHKPISKGISRGNAGLDNEMEFVEGINNLLAQEGPLDVILKGSNKETTIKGVTEVVHIGKEGESKGWKGDAKLITSSGSTHISIKKDGKYRWESVIKRYRDVFEAVMRKGMEGKLPGLELKPEPEFPNVLMMWDPSKGKPYGRIIITDHPQLQDDFEGMAFGPDEAIVVQRTFTEKDFSLSGKAIQVQCSAVAETLDDFEEGDIPVLEFERNASKASKDPNKDPKDIYGRGIGMRTTPYKHAKGGEKSNQYIISYEDLTK